MWIKCTHTCIGVINGPSKTMHHITFLSNFMVTFLQLFASCSLGFFTKLSWRLNFFCKAKKLSFKATICLSLWNNQWMSECLRVGLSFNWILGLTIYVKSQNVADSEIKMFFSPSRKVFCLPFTFPMYCACSAVY